MQLIVRTAIIVLFCVGQIPAQERVYDPMSVPAQEKIKIVDLTVKDDGRNRDIPIRVYYREMDHPAPVVLFSHGLGGSR